MITDKFKEERKEIRRLGKELRIIRIERSRIEKLKWGIWESLYAKKRTLGRLKADGCPALKFTGYGSEETGKVWYVECSLRKEGGVVYSGRNRENSYTNYCWLCILTPEQAEAKKVFKKIGGA